MNFGQLFLLINIGLIVSIVNIFHVIIGYARTLPGQVYMATGHYYLDYFIYLQSISQGMRGHFLFANQFATDDPGKTFLVYWPYLFIGKIARLFHLSPITAYWLSVFILTFIFVILIYILISQLLEKESFGTKIIALIFSLTSSSFLNIYKDVRGLHALPIDFWYAPSSLSSRFGGVPHHLLGNILILAAIITSGNMLKKFRQFSRFELFKLLVFLGLLFTTIMTFYPYQVVNLVIALLFTIIILGIRSPRNWLFSILLFILFGFIGVFIKLVSLRSSLISRLNQSDVGLTYFPPLINILQTIGPILLLSVIGIRDFLKKIPPIKLLFINFILISWVLTFSPLPSYVNNFNLRFLTSLSPVFFASFAVLGIKKVPNKILRLGITLILLVYFGFVSYLSFQLQFSDQNLFSSITYLPKGIIKGYEFLDTQLDNHSVLTSPSQLLGIVLPVFADRKVYIARHVFTPDYVNKADLADRFYLGLMNEQQTKDFLKKNDIGYVTLTSIEAYPADPFLKNKYLKTIYKNKDVIILKFLFDRP